MRFSKHIWTIWAVLSLAVVLVLFCGSKFGCTMSKRNGEKIEMMKGRAIEVARAKAIELGYVADDMTIDVALKGKELTIYFAPKKEVLGGDLTIIVDGSSGEILAVNRGQ